MGPVPIRSVGAEGNLRGKTPDDSLIQESGRLAAEECNPVDDLRGSADYKRDLVNESKLGNLGFSIFKIWECEIKSGDFTVLDHAIDHINTLKNHHKTNN